MRSADSFDCLANAPERIRRLAPKGIHVITAGAPPAASTIQRLEEDLGWTITHVYGLTETAPFITVCESRAEHAPLSISERAAIKARQGVELITSGELRVLDTRGNDVPRDGVTQGEIIARGNVVMAGYYNDPEATEKALRGGWFHTGDAAVVHPDGYVEIRDRLKDVIISGGENISSVEVEGVLLRHPERPVVPSCRAIASAKAEVLCESGSILQPRLFFSAFQIRAKQSMPARIPNIWMRSRFSLTVSLNAQLTTINICRTTAGT